MKPFVSPSGANTISGALMIIVLWYFWRFYQFDVPNEVVSAMQTVINAAFLLLSHWLERLFRKDLDRDGVIGGDRAAASPPAT